MENVLGRLIRIAIVIVAASGLMTGILALMSGSASDTVVLAIASPGYASQPNDEQSGTLILPHLTATLHLSPGIGFGPAAIGVNPTTGYIYVVNSSDEWQYHQGNPIVSVLSGTQVITNVQMSSRPLDVVVNPTNGYVYVTLDTDDLAVLNGTQVITTLPGVGGTVHAVNPNTGLVYMAKLGEDAVSVLNGTKVVTTIVVRGLRDIATAPNSGLVYVSAYPQDGTLIHQGTLNILSGTQVITVVTDLTDGPAAIGVNPVNGCIYVANSLTDTVTVVSDTEIIATVPTEYDLGYWAGGAVEVDPATGYVYVMGYDEVPFYGFVAVLSGTQRVKTIVGPTRPTAMAINPVNGDVYVTYKLCYHCDMFGYFTTTMLAINSAEISDVVYIDGDTSAVAVNPSNNHVYIAANRYESEPSVVILNGTHYIATARGRTPKVVKVNPISGRVYVVDPAHRSVAIIEDGRIIADVELDMIPSNLAVNPTTGLVYVTGYLSHIWTGTVAILNDIQVIARLNVGAVPAGVEVAPSRDYIYVAQYGGDVIVLSDTQIITTVAVGVYPNTTGPLVIKANPVNGYTYVGSSNGISVLSGTQVIALISASDYYDVRFIDVDSVSGHVYAVSDERLENWDRVSNVWIVSETQVVTQVTIEGSPTAFAINPANDYAYIATDNERVSILSGGQVITTFSAAAQTTAIAVNHASDYVYMTHQNDMVSVLSGTQVVTLLPAGDYPYDIAINPPTGLVYVVNHYGQSITVVAGVPVPSFRVYLPMVLRKAWVPELS